MLMRHLCRQVIPLLLSSWRRTTVTFSKLNDGVICNYSIATWSSKIKRSEVIKKGTPEDVLHLPPCKAHNKPHQQKRTFTVARSVVRKRAKAGTRKRDVLEVMGEFWGALGGVGLTWCLCQSVRQVCLVMMMCYCKWCHTMFHAMSMASACVICHTSLTQPFFISLVMSSWKICDDFSWGNTKFTFNIKPVQY